MGNVALHQPVTALDCQNEPRAPWQLGAFPDGPVWGLKYLVDGYASRNRLMESAGVVPRTRHSGPAHSKTSVRPTNN